MTLRMMEQTGQLRHGLTRRQFLALGWTLAGLLAAGEAAGVLVSYLASSFESEVFGARITLGTVADLARRLPLGAAPLYFPKARLYLSRTSDGLIALYERCTHLNYPHVPWLDREGRFHCPAHGALYDRTGECIGGPCPRPLDYFPLIMQNGYVVADTGRTTKRIKYDAAQALKV